MSTIDLTDVGPVQHISIAVPEAGGLIVLRGRNGSGKTKTLEAVESALTGRGKLQVRDGTLRGRVEAFGVALTLGRSCRRVGELEVTSLDGRLSVAELVDPGIKSPDAADAKRIKALVQLAGIAPSAELFWPLAGGREPFEEVVGTAALAADDVVSMAERVKRDFESAARKEESQADHAEGRARGAREAAAGIDVTAPDDGDALQSLFEAAIRRQATLDEQLDAYNLATRRAHDAAAKLAAAQTEYRGPPPAVAFQVLQDARALVAASEFAERSAEQVLRQAQAALVQARSRAGEALVVFDAAVLHDSTTGDWQQTLDEAVPQRPDTAAFSAAEEAVDQARGGVEAGALVRRAKQHLAEAAKAAEEAVLHRSRAESLREAAGGTDDVLSTLVARTGSALRVEAGRLVLTTGRGATYFADLSHGERWKLALDVAIDQVGERGVLTIPQEAYESLDPTNRRLLAEHVRGRGVIVLTAEASDDDEVTAEVVEPEPNP